MRRIGDIARALKEWGAGVLSASEKADATRGIEVLVELRDGEVPIGRLWQEDGFFFFKYLPEVRERDDIPKISAFPDVGTEYRSKTLFPFFVVRLPPRDRADVKRALDEMGLEEGDALRLLGELGARSPISPYIFRFRDDSGRASGPPELAPVT